jgi:lysylphosphatidylglycerol synthetase-like protein (DUF2156 family)
MTSRKDLCLKTLFIVFVVSMAIIAISFGWTYFIPPHGKKLVWHLPVFIISSTFFAGSLIGALVFYLKKKREEKMYEKLGYREGEGLL